MFIEELESHPLGLSTSLNAPESKKRGFLNAYSFLHGARLSLCEHLFENVQEVYELCDLLNKDSFL